MLFLAVVPGESFLRESGYIMARKHANDSDPLSIPDDTLICITVGTTFHRHGMANVTHRRRFPSPTAILNRITLDLRILNPIRERNYALHHLRGLCTELSATLRFLVESKFPELRRLLKSILSQFTDITGQGWNRAKIAVAVPRSLQKASHDHSIEQSRSINVFGKLVLAVLAIFCAN